MKLLLMQEQFIFIHEAMEEYIACGDTSIGVANLRIAMTKLDKPCGDDGKTLLDEQFQVVIIVTVLHNG